MLIAVCVVLGIVGYTVIGCFIFAATNPRIERGEYVALCVFWPFTFACWGLWIGLESVCGWMVGKFRRWLDRRNEAQVRAKSGIPEARVIQK